MMMTKEEALLAEVALPAENVRLFPFALQEECQRQLAEDKNLSTNQVTSAAVKSMAERLKHLPVDTSSPPLSEQEERLWQEKVYLKLAKIYKALFDEKKKKVAYNVYIDILVLFILIIKLIELW